jgi:bacterial/archaeal transporter family protein
MPQWLLFALLSAFFAALTAIFAKAGLKDVNPDVATAIRTAIILFITWGIVFFKGTGGQVSGLSKNNWVFLTLSAIATGASWLFYYRALQIGKASEVSIVDKGSILFTIFLAFLFLKEPLTPRLLVAVALIFTGMLVLVWR